jgi:hypothetical protein
MSNVSRVSLDDTLHLIQLMRETALAKGRNAQANRLEPVMEEMRGLAQSSQPANPVQPTAKPAVQPAVAPAAGILGQSDFQRLLEVSRSSQPAKPQAAQSARAVEASSGANSLAATLERNRLMSAMSAANMSEVDIAKQFGVSRDEVRLVLNVQNKMKPSDEEVIA